MRVWGETSRVLVFNFGLRVVGLSFPHSGRRLVFTFVQGGGSQWIRATTTLR